MNNNTLIANAAVAAGIMTPEEIEGCIASGREIPLHTAAGWNARNYKIKAGEHGIETRLWKKKSKKRRDQDEEDSVDDPEGKEHGNFYLAKSYLFHKGQVIHVGKEEP